jgi:hypothetical protein
MKRTLVSHSGVIQWKFIISNDDELMQYAKHKSIAIAEEFRGLIGKDYKGSDKPDTNIQKALKLTSTIDKVPLVASCDVLLKKVIMAMHKCILNGDKLAVNEAGGYCPWDDHHMMVIPETEENIRIANGEEPKDRIQINLNDGPILVLENQSEIPDKVEYYIRLNLEATKFSYIKNIQFDKSKLPELLKEALKKGHHTIVVQTTLIDEEQVKSVAELLESIPIRIKFLINASGDLEKKLIEIIGMVRTADLYVKHEIVQWYQNMDLS